MRQFGRHCLCCLQSGKFFLSFVKALVLWSNFSLFVSDLDAEPPQFGPYEFLSHFSGSATGEALGPRRGHAHLTVDVCAIAALAPVCVAVDCRRLLHLRGHRCPGRSKMK